MGIKLIASDLDGTLLTDEKEISAYTRETLLYAMKNGCQFIPATGRAFSSVPEQVKTFPGVEYVITSNGAAVYSVAEQKSVYHCGMDKESVEEVLCLPRIKGMTMEIFIDGIPYAQEDYIKDPASFGATPFGVEYIKRTRNSVSDIYAFARENQDRLDSMSFSSKDPEIKENIKRQLSRIKNIYVTSSVSHLVEIGHINAGKGNTLKWIMDKLCISSEDTMAFGDADNDIPMLQSVRYGIAMANGSDGCKKAACYITESNEEDGVAKAIRKFFK